MLRDAEENEHLYEIVPEAEVEPYELLLEDLRSLGGDKIALPSSLPSTPGRMISRLRSKFKDNVTLISRVLNFYFPDRFLFYRVSKLEEEIFEAFDFLSVVVPEFERLRFPRVGRKGFDRYLSLNDALLQFFKREYPDLKDPQPRIAWFLYRGLGELFLEKSGYTRYWIMATREEFFESLDSDDHLTWSGRKEMKAGDNVFMYRTAPTSAITDVLEVTYEPVFDPWGEWDGFWVDLERISRIDSISFSELSNDPMLADWGIVRKRFNGVITEPVPQTIYNSLLNRISTRTPDLHGLVPARVTDAGMSGRFVSEAEFEDEVIVPLLKSLRFEYERQRRCPFQLGSQRYFGRIDFFVKDEQGPITLFENKHRILDDEDLQKAVEQGKSYALMLGLPSFVVASPEGLWIYSLSRNRTRLEKHISTDDLKTEDGQIRSTLLNLRAS